MDRMLRRNHPSQPKRDPSAIVIVHRRIVHHVDETARGLRVVVRETACFVLRETARPAGVLLTRDDHHDVEKTS